MLNKLANSKAKRDYHGETYTQIKPTQSTIAYANPKSQPTIRLTPDRWARDLGFAHAHAHLRGAGLAEGQPLCNAQRCTGNALRVA